jgi:Beta-propeller repeat
VRFRVAAWAASQPLVIDPVLGYSTYLGGASNDEGLGIAVDAAGNAYVTARRTWAGAATTSATRSPWTSMAMST